MSIFTAQGQNTPQNGVRVARVSVVRVARIGANSKNGSSTTDSTTDVEGNMQGKKGTALTPLSKLKLKTFVHC